MSSAATQLQIPAIDGSVIRVPIDISQPLPGQIRAWVDQHASPLIRALLNEADRLHSELRSAIATRRAAEMHVVSLEERCATLSDYAHEMQALAIAAAERTPAARDVLAERARQVGEEEWTPEHDDEHADEELAVVAALYAMPRDARYRRVRVAGVAGTVTEPTLERALWPRSWREAYWKPTPGDRRRELVKAGALILAEIERLDRAAAQAPDPSLLHREAPDPATCGQTLNGREATT